MKNKFTVNGWQVLSTAGIKRRGITEVKQIRQAIAAANLVDDKDYHILRHARYANSYYFTASASLQVIKHLKASPVSEAAPPLSHCPEFFAMPQLVPRALSPGNLSLPPCSTLRC